MSSSHPTLNNTHLDEHQLHMNDSHTQFLIYFGIRVAQAVVGIIGNILTLIIISKLKHRVNGHIIMVYVAVTDILVCCILPMSYLRNSSIITEKHWKNFCVISEYLYNHTMTYFALSYITTSIDRYVKGYIYMSHFAYACKMRCPLNLVLEKSEYLWFY